MAVCRGCPTCTPSC